MNTLLLEAGSFSKMFQEFEGGALQVFAVFGATFALLNCFLGYKLVKLWAALAGFAVGWVVGFAVSMSFLNNAGICAVIGVAAGIALGAAAFFIYKAGVFLLCFFMVFSLCLGLIPIDWLGLTAGIILGIAVGILAMKFMREVLIGTTAVSGGLSAANSLLPVFGFTIPWVLLVVGIVLALAGIWVQWNTTGKRKTEL